MPARPIRVLVAEDYPPFRRFLASTIQNRPELQIVCEVEDGPEAVQKAVALQPELVLLDIGLSDHPKPATDYHLKTGQRE